MRDYWKSKYIVAGTTATGKFVNKRCMSYSTRGFRTWDSLLNTEDLFQLRMTETDFVYLQIF